MQTFPDCGGKHQSPIQIDTSKVIKESYQPIKEHGKSRRLKSVDVMNNGRSVQLIAKEDSNKPLITGGPMKNQIFKFEQFHFHWSANDTENCEHQITINNKNKTFVFKFFHYMFMYHKNNISYKFNNGINTDHRWRCIWCSTIQNMIILWRQQVNRMDSQF